MAENSLKRNVHQYCKKLINKMNSLEPSINDVPKNMLNDDGSCNTEILVNMTDDKMDTDECQQGMHKIINLLKHFAKAHYLIQLLVASDRFKLTQDSNSVHEDWSSVDDLILNFKDSFDDYCKAKN